jgi:hypothetical protein
LEPAKAASIGLPEQTDAGFNYSNPVKIPEKVLMLR